MQRLKTYEVSIMPPIPHLAHWGDRLARNKGREAQGEILRFAAPRSEWQARSRGYRPDAR